MQPGVAYQPSTQQTTTVVVQQTAPPVVQAAQKRERFADRILLNLLLSIMFPFWLFVWCCMCICEKR